MRSSLDVEMVHRELREIGYNFGNSEDRAMYIWTEAKTGEEIIPLIDLVGRLRVEVWTNEGVLDPGVAIDGKWLDSEDKFAYHWIAHSEEVLHAASRLTLYERLGDCPRQSEFSGYELPQDVPVALLSRLIVSVEARGKGFAGLSRLNNLGPSWR